MLATSSAAGANAARTPQCLPDAHLKERRA
jgi:hypothetical protein